MENVNSLKRDGALPVRTRQAGRVPSPMPRRGSPPATGGHRVPLRGARSRRRWGNATGRDKSPNRKENMRPLNILQWNAEGIYNKKVALTGRLHAEDIDVACIQETHLNPNHRFIVRGYQTFRMDRESRHKGGVVILVRNAIPATDFQVNSNQQAEIHGVKITVDQTVITIYNLYCPPDKDLSLQLLEVPHEDCIVLGDFNSHSTVWGYPTTNRRGEEVEDWQIEKQLVLLNDPEDPPTFFSRRWISTSTPDLAFATDNLSSKTSRKVQSQLAGSDHRPVKLEVNLQYKPQPAMTFPRWNYKRADWNKFSERADILTETLQTTDNINKVAASFNQSILQAAKETIPRGARKNYKPYWTEELQKLQDELSTTRDEVENDPTVENNIALKACSAKYKKTYIQAARKSWRDKTESLNLDRDGNKLWKLAKAMNDEDTRSASICINQDQEMQTGRRAANCLADHYAQVSNINIPDDRKREVHDDRRNTDQARPEEECMNKPFNMRELEEAMKTLREKKSPGPDKITNDMLLHLGTRAKKKLLDLFNNSWETGNVPQCWREADVIPIHKKGKDRHSVDGYRPISLTSCVGKLMERLINTRLSWHLEKNNLIAPEQAGFRHHRSTEDQVTYISQKIEDGFQAKHHTLAVWIDMEKAFDKVWKDGLRLKLLRNRVTGRMFQWISQYLNNRKARVRVNGAYSRKKTLKDGVPQGGVLSPTLFLIFINDIVKDLPKNVLGAVYADDLVLWSTEEFLGTANYRLQEVLKSLEIWMKKWHLAINARKTSYTIFSLSTQKQKVSLKIGGQALTEDESPKYLGVTFDKRFTWRKQIEKSESRGKSRLALMKKLAGTTWGADAKNLKKMYTGRVRPVLEYGITAWGAAAKTNFEKVSKVQHQATRIITGAMKSTPITALETITGLESIEDRKDTKLLIQAAKFKRLQNHPMKNRMTQPTKGRLKRGSFIHQSKKLESRLLDISDHEIKEIPTVLTDPSWTTDVKPVIQCSIPGVDKKDDQSDAERKYFALDHINMQYPQHCWTQVYTDGSAELAVRNGGAGIFIRYPGGKEEKISLATGLHSTNYKAEAVALQVGAEAVRNSPYASANVVFLSDALSVLQAIQTSKDKELNDLLSALASLGRAHDVFLQWIPSHCGISGNEAADTLAKEGSTKDQTDRTTSYQEARTIIKAKQLSKWKQQHPRFNTLDHYHQLTREEQVTIFRLRTGHNRLNYHLYTKFRIGESGQCPCQTGNMTTEHLLQECPLHNVLRESIWRNPISMDRKLYGSAEDLRCTASYVARTGVSI